MIARNDHGCLLNRGQIVKAVLLDRRQIFSSDVRFQILQGLNEGFRKIIYKNIRDFDLQKMLIPVGRYCQLFVRFFWASKEADCHLGHVLCILIRRSDVKNIGVDEGFDLYFSF